MSNSNLLNESQIRQFMKLASLEPLTEKFISQDLEEVRNAADGGGLSDARRGHGRGRGPADRLEEEADAEALDDYAAGDLERGHPGEAEHDELEADAELDDAGDVGGERTVSVDDFLSALESALEGVMGDEVEIDADELGDDVEADVELDTDEDDLDLDLDERQKYGGNKGDESRSRRDYMDESDDLEERQKYGGNKGDESRSKRDYMDEDKAYTSKREKPGADKRKGAEKRGAEATKLKHDEPGGRGHKKGDDAYVNEEQGADDREDEHLGAEDGKESGKKQSMKDRRKEMRGARRAAGEAGDPVPHHESVNTTDELVEQITKRVAARILKSALAGK
tara:strand:+ start:989 stop:2002 length:1014 start_codon:yes stop_codon:yes gene_type:complete